MQVASITLARLDTACAWRSLVMPQRQNILPKNKKWLTLRRCVVLCRPGRSSPCTQMSRSPSVVALRQRTAGLHALRGFSHRSCARGTSFAAPIVSLGRAQVKRLSCPGPNSETVGRGPANWQKGASDGTVRGRARASCAATDAGNIRTTERLRYRPKACRVTERTICLPC